MNIKFANDKMASTILKTFGLKKLQLTVKFCILFRRLEYLMAEHALTIFTKCKKILN